MKGEPMKEPKTVKDAKRLILKKIEECMKLPLDERKEFWYKVKWPKQRGTAKCAFCIIYEATSIHVLECKFLECEFCNVENACEFFMTAIEGRWLKKDLRTLYRMVEEVEG